MGDGKSPAACGKFTCVLSICFTYMKLGAPSYESREDSLSLKLALRE